MAYNTYSHNATSHHIYNAASLEVTLYAVVLVVGGIGNYFVVSVILFCKDIKWSAPFNLYLLALSIIDLVLSVLPLPLYIAKSSFVMSEKLYHIVSAAEGDILCRALASDYILFWLGIVESYILVVISIERRYAIVKPFSTLTRQQYVHPCGIVAIMFLFGAVVELPTMYGLKYNRNVELPNFCIYSYNHSTAKALYTTVAFFEYIIPLVVFIVCFSEVYQKLRQLQNSLVNGSLVVHVSNSTSVVAFTKHMSISTHSIDTMKWVIVVFVVCLTPNIVSYVVFQYLTMENGTWESSVYQFAIVLRFSHACFNPILYCFVSKEFRKHFFQVYPKFSGCSNCLISGLICRRPGERRSYSRLQRGVPDLRFKRINRGTRH